MRQWSHKEIEIWARRCEGCLEQVLGDFELEANGAAPEWGLWFVVKMLQNKKGKKLRYKGLIVVILSIGSLEVEPIAWLLQDSTIWFMKRYAPLPRQRSLARRDDRIWSFMGRTNSTLWFKRNGVKLKAVLHISLSSRKWCRDRSGGSSIADEMEGKLVLEKM